MSDWLRPGRILVFLALIGACAAGFRGGEARPEAPPGFVQGAPIVLCGPPGAWPALGVLEPFNPELVAWARRALVDVPPDSRVAVVLLPGSPWTGADSCRAQLEAAVDALEEQVAQTGAYPESLPAQPGGSCSLTYQCLGEDFELTCSRGLRYNSLEGLQGPTCRTAVLIGSGPEPEVRGLDRELQTAHKELLAAVWRETCQTQALRFHLEGPVLEQWPYASVEGTCLSDRLDLDLRAKQPHRLPDPSPEAVLEALGRLSAGANCALAVQPGLFDLPAGLRFTGLSQTEERHLEESMVRLTRGAVAISSDLILEGPAAWNLLRAGRTTLQASILVDEKAASEFLAGSPVLHRRVGLQEMGLARLQDGRLDLALGTELPADSRQVGEELLPRQLPGHPGAAGWLKLRRGHRLQSLRWAAGPGQGGLWLVAELSPGQPDSAPEPPTLTAGELDPAAENDGIAWDAGLPEKFSAASGSSAGE
ncbi:hypothetical protein DYH09_03865 [bacterium CPR1]|nr:hypothetical protein [bacterium CPR1]